MANFIFKYAPNESEVPPLQAFQKQLQIRKINFKLFDGNSDTLIHL